MYPIAQYHACQGAAPERSSDNPRPIALMRQGTSGARVLERIVGAKAGSNVIGRCHPILTQFVEDAVWAKRVTNIQNLTPR